MVSEHLVRVSVGVCALDVVEDEIGAQLKTDVAVMMSNME